VPVAAGIGSAEAFGAAAVARVVRPAGIGSAEAFGAPVETINVKLSGIGSAEAVGMHMIYFLAVFPAPSPTAPAPTVAASTWRGLRTLNIGIYPPPAWDAPMTDPNLRGHVERKR
jgi:hypothetical protein